MSDTSKAQIERVVIEVDVFCDTARGLIESFMPVGLGKPWQKEEQELVRMLDAIPARFKAAVEKAQREGWAAK